MGINQPGARRQIRQLRKHVHTMKTRFKWHLKSSFAALLLLGIGLVIPSPTHAATINVGCGMDTLIAAINTANANSDPDVLELSAGCRYEIYLSGHLLPFITSDLTINGNDATITRWYGSQAPQYSLLHVAPNVTLTVRDLNLDHGATYDVYVSKDGVLVLENCQLSAAMVVALDNKGTAYVSNSQLYSNMAGIWNDGTLTLTDTAVKKNYMYQWNGAGLQNGGNAVAQRASFEDNDGTNGGAIQNSGVLDVTETTFSGNTARRGAAIHNAGTLRVTDSTFVGNTAAHGGAVYNTGQLAVLNSTFTAASSQMANEANIGDGAAIWNSGSATLEHATIAGFSVGRNALLTSDNTLELANSLVTNAIPNCSGLVVDGGGNLRWSRSDPSCVGAYGDPGLGLLDDNGGFTKTMALAVDSPAINAALEADCPAADQRGIARPQGKQCDIGAFELEKPTAPNLLLPVDNKRMTHARVNLRWQAAERVVYYHVLVRQGSMTGAKVVNLRVTPTNYKTPALESGHWYYWRTKACSNVGCIHSEWRRFHVK